MSPLYKCLVMSKAALEGRTRLEIRRKPKKASKKRALKVRGEGKNRQVSRIFMRVGMSKMAL